MTQGTQMEGGGETGRSKNEHSESRISFPSTAFDLIWYCKTASVHLFSMTSQGFHECLASFRLSGQCLTLPLLSAEIDEESKTYFSGSRPPVFTSFHQFSSFCLPLLCSLWLSSSGPLSPFFLLSFVLLLLFQCYLIQQLRYWKATKRLPVAKHRVYLSVCAVPYYVQYCYFIQQSVICSAWPPWQCACVHACGSAAYCMSLWVLLCACSSLEVKDWGSRKSGVLIERQRCTVIIMKALQEKLNWRGREIERALWDMEDDFHLKESISFLADEPVEKIGISEGASVDMHWCAL